MKRDIDFHAVRDIHEAIHVRLLNWALWQRSGYGSSVLPMFRHYRDNYPESKPKSRGVIDSLDALKIQRAIILVPEPNRHALVWAYLRPGMRVEHICRRLEVNRAGLDDLIDLGRTMLKNRSQSTAQYGCLSLPSKLPKKKARLAAVA